jgi:hypothetical protein
MTEDKRRETGEGANIMDSRLLTGLAAVGLLAGGGSGAVPAAGAPAAVASTVAVASSTSIFRMHGCGPLEPLVAKGTITQAQASAIHHAFISYFHGHWRTVLDTVIGQLVKNHTITRAQASAVITDITQRVQNYKANGSGDHGPCHNGHDGGMTGDSGNR